MIFHFSEPNLLTHENEQDLRSNFERCIEIMRKTGDRIARVETLDKGIGTSAVICVWGEGDTFKAVQAADRLMDKSEKAVAK